jgi:hypothetical protein
LCAPTPRAVPIADWPSDDIARLIARYPPARLPTQTTSRTSTHRPEMPPKVVDGDEEEAEPLKNDVFGSVVQTIKGKSLPGGIRNSVTIYENGALVTSLQTYDAPACGFKQGCIHYMKGCSGSCSCPMYFCTSTCCPLNEARFMIPKHRFLPQKADVLWWCLHVLRPNAYVDDLPADGRRGGDVHFERQAEG